MKTALLHYWLTNMRGGEKVLAALGEMLPEADIFTHAFGMGMREKGGGTRYEGRGLSWQGHRVTESFIARLPLGRKHPQAYLPLMPAATRSLNLDGYDLIVSSESGPIKGIRKPAGARHICYCHTPMRYIWDMWDEYYREGGLIEKAMMKVATRYLRKKDLESADSVDVFIANSEFVAKRIERIYGRKSVIVHPPVDTDFFCLNESLHDQRLPKRGTYYLLAGELVRYKHPEIAIEACVKMNRKLVVVGTGEKLDNLQKLYGLHTDVLFLGRVDDYTLRAAYSNARALIFPGCEDFGIVPVEAQATGTPVIALRAGGALETIVENETGIFFDKPNAVNICHALEEFESQEFSNEACRLNAIRFSKDMFASNISKVLRTVI